MLAGLGVCCSESCKDVDVVSVAPQCLTSTAVESLAMGMGSEHILKDQPFYNSRIKFQDDSSLDYDSGLNNITVPSSVFEFQRADRGLQRAGLAPFFKAPPSKWDDAQKWIASPTTNQNTNRQLHIEGGVGLRKNNQFGYGSRQTSMKVVLEIPDQMLVTYGEPDIKRMELAWNSRKLDGVSLLSGRVIRIKVPIHITTQWSQLKTLPNNHQVRLLAQILVFPDCERAICSWYLRFFLSIMALN